MSLTSALNISRLLLSTFIRIIKYIAPQSDTRNGYFSHRIKFFFPFLKVKVNNFNFIKINKFYLKMNLTLFCFAFLFPCAFSRPSGNSRNQGRNRRQEKLSRKIQRCFRKPICRHRIARREGEKWRRSYTNIFW